MVYAINSKLIYYRFESDSNYVYFFFTLVVKLVDTVVLGTIAKKCVGSNPTQGKKIIYYLSYSITL